MQCDSGGLRVSESALPIDPGWLRQRRLVPTLPGSLHRAKGHPQPKKVRVAQIRAIRNRHGIANTHRASPEGCPWNPTFTQSSGLPYRARLTRE